MPELPEVETTASLVRDAARYRIIEKVETAEDKIVYNGITHEQFADILKDRKVLDVGRYGKVMYITLDGEGPMPVLHLGMTGMIHVKGRESVRYGRAKRPDETQSWPPRFMKFVLHLAEAPALPATQIAFVDPRRLGRVRVCAAPLQEPPISNLGFDPLISMLPLEEFCVSVRKRSCAIKALLLDQSFSAGVGNWVADEVLYQSRVHPEQRANTLTMVQLTLLHIKIVDVCRKAVDVDADSSRFPEDWLFRHRWGKGKKSKHTMLLPDGKPATIKWIKVGGRTSAYITELQVLPKDEITNLPEASTISSEELTGPSTPSKREMNETIDNTGTHSASRSRKRIRMFALKETEVVEEQSSIHPSPTLRGRRKAKNGAGA